MDNEAVGVFRRSREQSMMRKPKSTARQLRKCMESQYVHMIVIGLIAIDVILVVVEMVVLSSLEAELVENCESQLALSNSTMEEEIEAIHDFYAGRSAVVARSAEEGGLEESLEEDLEEDLDKEEELLRKREEKIETFSLAVRWLSISLVILFILENLVLCVALGLKEYVLSIWHPIDLVVLSLTLAVELLVDSETVAFLIVLRLWRVIRIIQGILVVQKELGERAVIKLKKLLVDLEYTTSVLECLMEYNKDGGKVMDVADEIEVHRALKRVRTHVASVLGHIEDHEKGSLVGSDSESSEEREKEEEGNYEYPLPKFTSEVTPPETFFDGGRLTVVGGRLLLVKSPSAQSGKQRHKGSSKNHASRSSSVTSSESGSGGKKSIKDEDANNKKTKKKEFARSERGSESSSSSSDIY